jgi:transcriptional regulator with XRE-family HTH domain
MTKKIQRIMRLHNLTQRQTAWELGVTETWVSLVLHRKGKSMRILRYIARKTGTSVSEFLPAQRKAA